MGVKLAVLGAAIALATPVSHGVDFLRARQLTEGSFAEPGRTGYPQLTAWAALGLRAAGQSPSSRAAAIKYLVAHEPDLKSATDIALVALAQQALGGDADRSLARLQAAQKG